MTSDCGVYLITHKSGKLYVGSSGAITQRIYHHTSALRKGQHTNQKLQRAWTKYGENEFTFRRAQRHTPEAKARIGEASRARVRSPETRLKMSLAMKKHYAEKRNGDTNG